MSRGEHLRQGPREWGFAVLTVSDSRSEREDGAGRRARELATEAGHREIGYGLVPDEPDQIRRRAAELLEKPGVEVLIVTGGTGFSPRDRTPEALEPLFERAIGGFGELFRMLSWSEVGSAAMLSRATAGVLAGKLVFLLPGSPRAVELAMSRLILPESGHLLGQLRGLS